MPYLRSLAFLILAVVGSPALALTPAVSFRPSQPSARDVITVTACYPVGPFVGTTSVSVSGSLVTVRFVQDGLDFSPNPPHCAEVRVGPLPAGTYSFVVTSELQGDPLSTQSFALSVSALAVPIGYPAQAVLAVLVLLAGMRHGITMCCSGCRGRSSYHPSSAARRR